MFASLFIRSGVIQQFIVQYLMWVQTGLWDRYVHLASAIWRHHTVLWVLVQRSHIVTIKFGKQFLWLLILNTLVCIAWLSLLSKVLHLKSAANRLHWLVDVAFKAAYPTLLVLVDSHAHFLFQLRVKSTCCAWTLHLTTHILDRRWELLNLAHDGIFDHAVVNHIFVVISAPSAEEVNHWLAS